MINHHSQDRECRDIYSTELVFFFLDTRYSAPTPFSSLTDMRQTVDKLTISPF